MENTNLFLRIRNNSKDLKDTYDRAVLPNIFIKLSIERKG